MNEGNLHGQGGLPLGAPDGLSGYTGTNHDTFYEVHEGDLDFSETGHRDNLEPFIPRRSAPAPPNAKHSAASSQMAAASAGANSGAAYSNGSSIPSSKEPRIMVPTRQAPPPPKKTGLGPGGGSASGSSTLQRSKTTGASTLPTRKYSDGRPLNSTYLGQLEPVHSDTNQTNKSFKGAVNKLFSSMFDSLSGESRSEISAPYNPIHLTHVGFNNETGEFTGLPREWSIMLREAGISKQDQEANPQAVVEVMRFYQENTKHHDDNVWMKMASLEKSLLETDAGRQLTQASSQSVSFAAKETKGSPPPQLPQIGDPSTNKMPANINTGHPKLDQSSRADQYSPQYHSASAAGPPVQAPYRHQHSGSDGSKPPVPNGAGAGAGGINQLQRAYDEDADQTRYRQPQPQWQNAAKAKPGYGQQNYQPQPAAPLSSAQLNSKSSQNIPPQQQQQPQQLQQPQQQQMSQQAQEQHQSALKRGLTLPSNPRDQMTHQQQQYAAQHQQASASSSGLKKQSSSHQLKRGPAPNPYAQQPVPQVQQAVYQSKPPVQQQPSMQPAGVQ
ncbi:hypothetical protein GGF37_001644, partial [Kickxella alabastrina]